jgi:uncharacterized protein
MIRNATRAAAVFTVAFFLVPAISTLDHAHARADANGEAAPALWRLERGDATLWLFGTFHLLPPDLHWRSDAVNAAFDGADTLWLEADVTSPAAQAATTALLPQLGMNPPGVTLSSLLDSETERLLNDVVTRMGASPAALQPLRPWLAALMLTVHQMQALGFDSAWGADAVLSAEAKAAGKQIGYFETATEQLGFFADIPVRAQVDLLAQTLREMDELPAILDALTVSWLTGDIETIDTTFNESMRKDAPELFEILMVNRNRAWVSRIVEIAHRGGTHFIAVGAGHLPGPEGLVELLREAGFEATR